MMTSILWLLFLVMLPQEEKEDSSHFINEMTQIVSGDDYTGTAVWYPGEFFRRVLTGKGNLTPAEIEKAVALFEEYPLFAVVLGRSVPGRTVYLPEATIRETIVFVDEKGRMYRPLAPARIPAELRAFTASLRPVLTEGLGAAGVNMALIYFHFPADGSMKIPDPKARGSFRLEIRFVSEEERAIRFRWTLPFRSLIPTTPCPECGRACEPDWNYCPWDGTKISE